MGKHSVFECKHHCSGTSAARDLRTPLVCRLIDHIGGIDTAIALCKQEAEIPAEEQVTVLETSVDQPSITALLSQGGLTRQALLAAMLSDPLFWATTVLFTVVPAVLQVRAAGLPRLRIGLPALPCLAAWLACLLGLHACLRNTL